MEREQAVRLTQNLLRKMVERDGSDLFITAGFPPAIKVDGTIHKATDTLDDRLAELKFVRDGILEQEKKVRRVNDRLNEILNSPNAVASQAESA